MDSHENRLRRFLDAAADEGAGSVPFIDQTKLTRMSKTFEWAADALSLEIFRDFAKDPAIRLRQPRRGWCTEAPPHALKKAPWVSAAFVIYLARRACKGWTPFERVRAFFLIVFY